MKPVIEVVIDTHGSVRVQTKGFAGAACRQASAQLERALGLRTAESLTAEFHQSQSATGQLREGP